MNIQETLKRIEAQKETIIELTSWAVYVYIEELIKSLDEPEKIKIPQFVADWIEVAKTVYSLSGGMTYGGPGVNKWLENEDNQRTFVLAWLDGYEVEEEPKYTVKFKATNQYLCDDDGIGLHISPSFRSNFRKSDLEKLNLTEVFDSPLFELEEVTE